MSTPRRGRKYISENVRHLHNALTKILNEEDRTYLIHSLNQYQKDRDVQELVRDLQAVLNSPKKREVYPLLREIIPSGDRNYFDRNWHGNRATQYRPSAISTTRSRSRSPNRSQRHLRRSSLPDKLNKYDSGVDLPDYKSSTTPRNHQKYPIRRLHLKRSPSSGFGFCMRGGSEHRVGLYVSSVDDNSVAESEGLLPGDHILIVNDILFDGLSHDQAVKIIRNSKKLKITVRSVGRIPNTFVAESTYKWIDSRGNRISPPPNVDSSGRVISADGIHKSDLRLLGDDDERKVNVFVGDGAKLGLMIRGGAEYGLGIYIAGVDPYSAADRAGLKCGDQIMDVNGTSFLNISHEDAIKVLKSNKNMMVTMKDVGRLPFAKTVKDKTKWSKGQMGNGNLHSEAEPHSTTTVEIHQPPANTDDRQHTHEGSGRLGFHNVERPEESKFSHGIAGTQLLYNGTTPSTKYLTEEQARQVLNENELGTMTYYMDEYTKGFITVDSFVLALFDLFNTPSKVSLLSEIRGTIQPKDIDRFDELVLKREIEAIKARHMLYTHVLDDARSMRSYCSSMSSYSERDSISSRSSTKESLDDSRPITPPRVPDVLPPNIKVKDDLREVAMALPIHQSTPEGENDGLPSFLPTDNKEPNDSDSSLPPPPPDCDLILPISTSSSRTLKESPRDTYGANENMTNGEVTTNLMIGDNTRQHDQRNETREGKSTGSPIGKTTGRSFELDTPGKHHSRHHHSSSKHDPHVSRSSKQSRSKHDSHVSASPRDTMINDDVRNDAKRGFYIPYATFPERTTVSGLSVGEEDSTVEGDTSYSPNQTILHDSSPAHRNVSRERVKHRTTDPTRAKTKQLDKIFAADIKKVPPIVSPKQSTPGREEVSGMHLAMEMTASNRSGLERSTHWGEESLPSMSRKFDAIANETDSVANPLYECVTTKPSVTKPVRESVTHSQSSASIVNRDDDFCMENPIYECVTMNPSATSVPQQTNDNASANVSESERTRRSNATQNPEVTAQTGSSPPLEKKSSLVSNMVQVYNQLVDQGPETSNPGQMRNRRDSGANRKSWDGVRSPEEVDDNRKVSSLEQKKYLKSSSDSNLMNLPKEQQKSIQMKLRASQELYDLHHQSKTKGASTNSSQVSSPTSLHDASAYEVEVEKSSLGLGLTVDGGCDTQSPEVKIKGIKVGDYAAHKCGRLQEGQVILEINGRPVQVMTNGMVTLTLRQAYSDPDTDTIRLLVKDP